MVYGKYGHRQRRLQFCFQKWGCDIAVESVLWPQEQVNEKMGPRKERGQSETMLCNNAVHFFLISKLFLHTRRQRLISAAAHKFNNQGDANEQNSSPNVQLIAIVGLANELFRNMLSPMTGIWK